MLVCNFSNSVLELSEASRAEESCLVRRLVSDSSRWMVDWESESVDWISRRETSRSQFVDLSSSVIEEDH